MIVIVTILMVIVDIIGYVYMRDMQLRIRQLEHENKHLTELITTMTHGTLKGLRAQPETKTLLKD